MGRPSKLTKEEREEIVRLRIQGYSYKELSQLFNCSHPVINRALRRANLVKARGAGKDGCEETIHVAVLDEQPQSLPKVGGEAVEKLLGLIDDESTVEDW